RINQDGIVPSGCLNESYDQYLVGRVPEPKRRPASNRARCYQLWAATKTTVGPGPCRSCSDSNAKIKASRKAFQPTFACQAGERLRCRRSGTQKRFGFIHTD